MRRLWLFLLLLMAAPAAFASAGCREIDYKSIAYTVCKATLADDLRLWHSGKTGAPYGSFRAINRGLAAGGKILEFAMNAGMYHQDRTPVGLYIENGKQITALADGGTFGNFGLKPNGVFCVLANAFRVIETNAFRKAPPACKYATQSGPLLVIDGQLHHRFLIDSTSRYIRNGVGVSPDNSTAYFVISNQRVTFHQFGSFFRDYLKTPDALYFDGKVSRLHAPGLQRSGSGFTTLGAMIGVVVDAP
jgi:uncharacterized protein YigE (DUF2233 family)